MGMDCGEPRPQRLAETMPERAPEWAALMQAHGLRAPPLLELVGDSFHYLDMLFGAGREHAAPPFLLSTIKLRRAGFAECADSEGMLAEWLGWMQAQRILPPR